ncbi:hypothetical protein BH23ACT9_BH23ACT9_11160 [soil metagenome]
MSGDDISAPTRDAEDPTPDLSPEANENLSEEIRAVEAAREKLVTDIDVLDSEVRLEVLFRMESLAWKAVAGVAAAVAGIAATKLLGGVWRQFVPDHEPPDDPSDPRESTRDAILWTGLTGLGVGIATVIAQRGAAKGWVKATGRIPPAFENKNK